MEKEEVLSTARSLREAYFPKRHQVGDCTDICLGIGSLLKHEKGLKVQMVYGQVNDCHHTWLSVEGVDVDVSTDCTYELDLPFVVMADHDGYIVTSRDPLELSDFVPLSWEQYRELYLIEKHLGADNG